MEAEIDRLSDEEVSFIATRAAACWFVHPAPALALAREVQELRATIAALRRARFGPRPWDREGQGPTYMDMEDLVRGLDALPVKIDPWAKKIINRMRDCLNEVERALRQLDQALPPPAAEEVACPPPQPEGA